jgi:hypothetical protein
VRCSDCRHENSDEARFCAHCGARLSTVCTGCGTMQPPEARFCPGCGRAVAAAPAPAIYTPRHKAAGARHWPVDSARAASREPGAGAAAGRLRRGGDCWGGHPRGGRRARVWRAGHASWGRPMSGLAGGPVTLLFTDIEGSTRLVKALRERWPQVLAEHRRLVRAALGPHAGAVPRPGQPARRGRGAEPPR